MTMTSGARELEAASLRRTHPPETLGFGSTEEVQPLEGPVGLCLADLPLDEGLQRLSWPPILGHGPILVPAQPRIE